MRIFISEFLSPKTGVEVIPILDFIRGRFFSSQWQKKSNSFTIRTVYIYILYINIIYIIYIYNYIIFIYCMIYPFWANFIATSNPPSSHPKLWWPKDQGIHRKWCGVQVLNFGRVGKKSTRNHPTKMVVKFHGDFHPMGSKQFNLKHMG